MSTEQFTVFNFYAIFADEFNIYTREAGAGGLSIAVEGPSKAEVDFEDRKDGSCGVTYNVSEPGRSLSVYSLYHGNSVPRKRGFQ